MHSGRFEFHHIDVKYLRIKNVNTFRRNLFELDTKKEEREIETQKKIVLFVIRAIMVETNVE